MRQSNRSNHYYNHEGYPDPTAYECIRKENELENKVRLIIKAFKIILELSGFELVNRIEIKDVKSGRKFK